MAKRRLLPSRTGHAEAVVRQMANGATLEAPMPRPTLSSTMHRRETVEAQVSKIRRDRPLGRQTKTRMHPTAARDSTFTHHCFRIRAALGLLRAVHLRAENNLRRDRCRRLRGRRRRHGSQRGDGHLSERAVAWERRSPRRRRRPTPGLSPTSATPWSGLLVGTGERG
jgi:hypothetical protein